MEDHFHIYKSVSGALLSWKTAKSLGILPPKYPEPLPEIPASPLVSAVRKSGSQMLDHTSPVTKEDLMKEFPTVFDGQIWTMPGEVFTEFTEFMKMPSHSASAHLGLSPMHTWGQPRMNLSSLSPRASSPSRLSLQTGARPSWSHERRTLNASGSA